jgi:AcrR family transcriptional regulator
VARTAGIGKGTIYLHFRSVDELALSTIDRLVGRVLARLEEASASDRLRQMLVARVMVRSSATSRAWMTCWLRLLW